MKLYHGSDVLVIQPDLKKGKPFKDFGRGFYLSDTYEQAEAMGERVASRSLENNRPVVSTFDFEDSALNDGSLKVKRFDSYTKEWAEFVLNNRNRKVAQPTHDYDIVYGPIADDTIVRQMRRFELGDITIDDLMKELQYPHGITFQYFFGSEKALQKLTFIC